MSGAATIHGTATPGNVSGRSPLRRRLYARIPLGLRQGALYWSIRGREARAERWPKERIAEAQLQAFKRVLAHAYATVPGYNALCRQAGVTPADIRTLEDRTALPLMTKELVRDNLEEFTSRAIPRRLMRYEATTGSSGIPFGFYMTARSDSKEDAFMHEGWERAGWRLGDRSVVLRGGLVGSRDRFWSFNEKKNDLVLSTPHLDEETYESFITVIERFHPLHMRAYPSAAAQMADLVIARGHEGRVALKCVLLGSEQIYPWQRKRILAAFPGARIYGWYGQTEQVILAGMCESSELYHIHPLYGYAEIRTPEGREAAEGEAGELVGTSFWGYATPLIRYRTLDLARRGSAGCPHCGRASQILLSLDGRVQEVVLSGSGRRVTLTTIAGIHSHLFDNLQQFRFLQETPGIVEFHYRPKGSFSEADEQSVRASILERFGEGFEVRMKRVDAIPRGAGGKFRFLDQRIAGDLTH